MGARSPRGRRPTRRRERHRRLLVICGGKVTEPEYLEHVNAQLRASGVTIEIAKSGQNPQSLVSEAAARQRADRRQAKLDADADNTFESVWVVFDVDEFADEIPDALELGQRHGITCVVSNPCFEIWLLWHVENSGAYCSTRDAQRKAARSGVVSPHKRKRIQLRAIEGHYAEARSRAQSAAQTHREAGRGFPSDNPRSDMHVLIDYILDGVKRARPGTAIAL